MFLWEMFLKMTKFDPPSPPICAQAKTPCSPHHLHTFATGLLSRPRASTSHTLATGLLSQPDHQPWLQPRRSRVTCQASKTHAPMRPSLPRPPAIAQAKTPTRGLLPQPPPIAQAKTPCSPHQLATHPTHSRPPAMAQAKKTPLALSLNHQPWFESRRPRVTSQATTTRAPMQPLVRENNSTESLGLHCALGPPVMVPPVRVHFNRQQKRMACASDCGYFWP
ncbi:hypothetical protein B0T26DRAFT_491576 [Lasiosphaeria miniovina]|uniref:Uncharacterized protein n=1 Tax=Lasiosphaeria miniovina TaxID=1954250 RepID=A0AA39ZT73_9PEZI|nr:uncharacterized protein B0T26DRAFT_491576 [Lasiosphaeria miniovina]KAK0703166.1 hypothetical protein B0T26DRAFT_491576 [Lasiosphaeria miniovina]